MYTITSKDLNIRPHHCFSYEVASLVKNYINSKYDVELVLTESKHLPYFDTGGARLIDSFFTNVTLDKIECRIDDLDYLVTVINSYNITIKKDFYRISSWKFNLCYSKDEILDIRSFIKENSKTIEEYILSVEKFYVNKFPSKNYLNS